VICSGAEKTTSGVFALDFARYDKLSVSLCHFDRSGEYAVRGRRRMDCIARFGNGRASRESASQISHFFPSRLGPNSKRCLHFGRHDKNNTRVAKPRQRVGVSNAPRRLLPECERQRRFSFATQRCLARLRGRTFSARICGWTDSQPSTNAFCADPLPKHNGKVLFEFVCPNQANGSAV